jgi:hypothetical protein
MINRLKIGQTLLMRSYCLLILGLCALVPLSIVKAEGFSWHYYGDFYYGKTPFQALTQMPYFVSSYQLESISTNIQVLDLQYESERWKWRITPGIGDYFRKNYAAEPAWARHFIEAKLSYLLHQSLKLWIDIGIMNSPFTPETPTSWDHALYTRSLAPEYVPYYIEGIKLTMPTLNERLWLNLYLITGWQHIVDNNKKPALSWDIELRLPKHSFHAVGFLGDEWSQQKPALGYRSFFDFNYIYQHGKLWLSSDLYYGIQALNDINQANQDVSHRHRTKFHRTASWWQANLQMKYELTTTYAISSRLEYFHDPQQIQVTPVLRLPNALEGFKTAAFSLGISIALNKNIKLRFEGRQFFLGSKNTWQANTFSQNRTDLLWLVCNLTLLF